MMQSLLHTARRFLRDENGLELIEYAIIGGLITAGTLATVGILAATIAARLDDLSQKLDS